MVLSVTEFAVDDVALDRPFDPNVYVYHKNLTNIEPRDFFLTYTPFNANATVTINVAPSTQDGQETNGTAVDVSRRRLLGHDYVFGGAVVVPSGRSVVSASQD